MEETQAPGMECAQTEAIQAEKQARNFWQKLMALFSKENRKKVIILFAVAVIAICTVFTVIAFRSPKSIAKRYAVATIKGDTATTDKYMAYDSQANRLWHYKCENDEEKFFELQSLESDEDITSWKDYYRAIKEARKEDLEDTYGKYRISAEVTSIKDISNKKLESEVGLGRLAAFEEHANFDKDTISKAKVAKVKAKITGEDGIERYVFTVYLVKNNGSWSVLYYDFDRD